MESYTTIQGDMVDIICRKTYGDESGYVEQVLEANQGLAAKGPVLPVGTVVNLPELEVVQTIPVISLWD